MNRNVEFLTLPPPFLRLLLSAVSDYFSAMFTSDVREASEREIRLEDVDPAALQALVQFMYTGRIDLLEETVENLLSTACLLQVRNSEGWRCHGL
jgi:kelch-like protein 1/4/5